MQKDPRHIPAEATSLMDLARRLSTELNQGYREGTEGAGEIVYATVADAFSHMHSYILLDAHTGFTPAFLASPDSSQMPIGVKNHSMIMPGTGVVAWMPDNRDWGVILGTRGLPTLSRNLALPYAVVPGSRVGLFDDVVHNLKVFSDKESTGVINASAGRPVDTLPGEWGQSNEFGLMIHMGRVMLALKATETAGLYFNWLDNSVRLWSYNYEHFTAGSERYAYNDEGEFTDRRGSTPYPWEALGSFGPLAGDLGTETTKELEDGALKPNQEDVSVEPAHRDQAPIWRRQQFEGFLGGMHHDIIQVPRVPVDAAGDPTTDPERFSRASIYPGLLSIHRGLNGSYSVRSAKEITHEKVILIPAPKEQKLPADPLGDHKDNFSAAGRQWSRLDDDGKPVLSPEVDDLNEFKSSDTQVGERVAKLMEYHSYLYNVYNVQGFRLHPKDWAFPDEEDIKPAKVITNGVETTEDIDGTLNDDVVPPPDATDYYMPLPKFGEVVIDHRTRARYYKSRSIIKQLDDGSILIEDGWGSQIRMEGGSVFITASLDVVLQPGRSLIGMAPTDVVMRAGNSVDITASKRDVRIKAERNLHALAGNSGEGGMLLESRGQGDPTFGVGEDMRDGGITFRATNSNIRLLARRLGLIGDDEVVVDSGSGDVLIKAPTGDVLIDATTLKTLGAFESALDVNTPSLNGVAVGALSFPTGVAPPFVPTTVGLAATVDAASKLISEAAGKSGFTLRTPAQYQLESGTFVWFESRWQQYYRRNKSKVVWNEKDVVTKGVTTQPYPGRELWQKTAQFRTISDKLFNLEKGRSKPFSDLDVEDNEVSDEPTPDTLADGYLITQQGLP